MVNFTECVSKKNLEKTKPSLNKALMLLEKAESFYADAKKALENDMLNSALISSYAAFLNASRALMFADGWREKQSHACVVAYVNKKYKFSLGNELILFFENLRISRNKTQYSPNFYPNLFEAEESVKFAAEFIKKVWKILENRKK